MDAILQFKEMQKVTWSGFAVLENFTASVAPKLVRFAKIRPGQAVLDVGCGTGVVALTAARAGARVTGVDLTPALVARAKEHAALAGAEVTFLEGDAEAIPLPDSAFDVVVSQFGHMFAPRPDVVVKEMLRVLKPGGTIAFSTWPPELIVGQSFALMGQYLPPPPEGVSPPVQWGDPTIVRERLGTAVKGLTFHRDTMVFPVLSPQHYRLFMEQNFLPVQKLLGTLDASDPARAAKFRRETEELGAMYFEDNAVRQGFLMSRAEKA